MKQKLAKIFIMLVAFAAFWFLGVDGSWFVEQCPDCSSGKDIFQIRVFTVPIYQRAKEYHSVLEKITEDLGIPCRHSNSVRWHKHRYWGLLICAYPCINGTYRLIGGDEWYDDRASAIIKEMAKNDPSLRQRFSEQVLKNHDWKFLKAFVRQVSDLSGNKPKEIQKHEQIIGTNDLQEPEARTQSGRGVNRIEIPAIVITNLPPPL